jgi:hypothetical protein
MAAHPFVVAPVPRVRRRAGTAIGPDAVRGRVAAAGRVQPKAFEPPPHAAELLPRSSSIVGALSSTEVANQARALVAGDLNHEPDAATTLLLTGPPGSKIRTPRLPPARPGRRPPALEPSPSSSNRPNRLLVGWKGTVSPVAGPSPSTRKLSRSRIGRVTSRRVTWPATAIPSAGRWPKAETAAYRISLLGRAERESGASGHQSLGASGWAPTFCSCCV